MLQIILLKTVPDHDPDPDPTYKKSPHFSCPAYFAALFSDPKNLEMSPEVSTLRNFCSSEVFCHGW